MLQAAERRAIGLCYATMTVVALALNLQPMLLTTLGSEFGGGTGLTNAQMGAIGAVTFAGTCLGVVLTGPLADRLGAKPFVVGGNALAAAGLALLGLSPTYGAVLLAVFVMGLGAGVLDMVVSPIVGALQPLRRTSALNWLHSFYCTGAVSTALAVSLLLKAGVGWRGIALGLAMLPILVCFGILGTPIPRLVREEDGARMPVLRLCREPCFLAALAAIFLAGSTEVGMVQWLPAYAEGGLGFSQWIGGLALLAFSVAMGAGRIISGIVGHRVKPFRLMLSGALGAATLYAVGSLAPAPAIALGACVLAGLAVSCLWPIILGTTADRFPHGGGSMFGLLGALGSVGGVVAPWGIGKVADLLSLRSGILSGALAPLGLMLILLWMARRMESGRGNAPPQGSSKARP